MKTAVITVVRGREAHLRRQLDGLARSGRPADSHVVVALDDPRVAGIVASEGSPATVLDLAVAQPLPIAQARNRGADEALRQSAELLVFLDVDCIPHNGLIGRYHDVAVHCGETDALLCGPVTYLPPPGPHGYAYGDLVDRIDPHPARPHPPDDLVVPTDDFALFWSLSFAVTARTWRRIGGFCEQYRGYGGEDTDFAQSARAAGVSMFWVGGAHAFHQFHPAPDPPLQHVDDIVRNAVIFHHRWGWWPMRGWLRDFERIGLIERDATGAPHHAVRG